MTETPVGAPVPDAQAVPAPVAAEPATDAVEIPETQELTEAQKWEKSRAKMERRISTLTARTAQERAEKALLQQRLEALEKQAQQPASEEPQHLTEDEVERRAGEKARHALEIQRVNERANKVAIEGKKEFPDFMDRWGELNAALGPQFGSNGRPTAFMEAVLESDAPTKLLHHLATDLDLAAEIAELPPHRMTRRLVQLESELSEKPKPSSAPSPIKPVKSSVAAGEPDPENTEAWIRHRNKTARTD